MHGNKKLIACLAQTVPIILMSLLVSPRAMAVFDEDHIEAINGTHLHFRVRGKDKANPYLLVLHGGPGASALEFYPWGRLLEESLNVVYLDQRGSGLSERKPFATPGHPTDAEAEAFTFDQMMQDIEGVREALGVEKWFVLGHSFGGMLGIEYVTAYSEHVAGYIHMDGLTSMPVLNDNWLNYAEQALRVTARSAQGEEASRVKEVLANIALVRQMDDVEKNQKIGPMVISRIWPERIRDRFEAANIYDHRIDAEVFSHYGISPQVLDAPEPGAAIQRADDLAEREVVPLFDDIRLPVLILSGAEDPIITPRDAAEMHARIPGSQLLVIPQAGHELYKDQPDVSANTLLQFVRRSKQRTSCSSRRSADGAAATPFQR